MTIFDCLPRVAIALAVLGLLVQTANGHEGHAPLPTKGAQVDVEQGLVTLSADARSALGVQTAEVTLRRLQQSVLAYATVMLDWQQHRFVTTPIAGRIDKLYVKPGQIVETGEALGEIDSTELSNLQLQLLDAQASLNLSEKTLTRLEGLALQQAVTGREVAEARAAHAQNSLALEIATSKLRRLHLSEEQIATILRDRSPIQTLTIRSPLAGVAIHTDLALGKFVDPMEHLFEILDLTSVAVRIDVLEQDLGKIAPGQPVMLSMTALPDAILEGAIETEEAYLDSTSHLGRAWVVLPNNQDSAQRLVPGMYGQARVVISPPGEKLAVPQQGLLTNGTEWFVLVEEASTARASEYRKRNVAVGVIADGWAEITAGELVPGDRVVTTGSHEMTNFFIQGVLRLSSEARKNLGVAAEAVQKLPVDDIREVEGVIELPPEQRAFASSPLAGTIESIRVKRGQQVKQGDVVAEVASLELLQTQYTFMQAGIQSQLLKETLGRLSQLDETQPVARKRLIDLQSQYDRAVYEREGARQRLVTLGLTSAQLDNLLTERRLVELLPVRSPIDGVVVQLDKALGQVVQANQPLLEIHDLSRIIVRAHLGERDLAKASIGSEARVRVVADPAFVGTGKVVRSGNTFEESNRTNAAWIELDQQAVGNLYNQMLTRVTFVDRSEASVLAIPKTALVTEGTRNFVFVEGADGILGRRSVTVGRSDDRSVEVLSGLTQGESVIVAGAANLQTAYASLR